MPMERSKCTECAAPIGGQQHISVRGVRKLNEGDLRGDPPSGYDIPNTDSECVRLTTLSCRVLRFFLHNLLLISACLSDSSQRSIGQLIGAKSGDEAIGELSKRLHSDWKSLRNMTNLPSADLALSIHSVIHTLTKEVLLMKCNVLYSTSVRNREEKKLSLQIERIMTDRHLKEKIEEIREELKVSGDMSMIRLATGEALWFEIHEHHLSIGQKADRDTLLWRYREPVSFRHFKNFCTLRASDLAENYQLLKRFMEEESRLHHIRGIADVLAWHAVLFEAFPHRSISRIEAIDISNEDAIHRLPQSRQEEARAIFHRFARVFNEILPTIDPLYECQANPFIAKDATAGLDLGDGKQMQEDVSVAFSLPSMVTGSDKGDFINGVCTIKILETLVDAQNEILTSLERSVIHKRRTYKKFRSKKHQVAAAREQEESDLSSSVPVAAAVTPREEFHVPAVSYRTPIKVLEKQLIMYDRNEDLLPLLRIFSSQSLEYGEGGILDYDLSLIQSSLSNSLLVDRQPINLCIRHYQYQGDIKRMGHLENLPAKIPQEPLASVVLDTIEEELNTQNRLVLLMQQLEVCIAFIVSVGPSSVRNLNGSTPLSSYVVETLHIPQEEWETISTPTIRRNVCLRHLQALYVNLEEKLYGDPVEDVLEVFCDPLSSDEEATLRLAAENLRLDVVLPVFRTFLLQQLTSSGLEPHCNLKEYLEYASEQSADLSFEDEDWWIHFPDSLALRCAKSTFRLLQQFASY